MGFSRRRSGCAFWITRGSHLGRAYDFFRNKELVGVVPQIHFTGPFDSSHEEFGGLYAGTYMASPFDASKVAGYAGGSCANLTAAKVACEAMPTCAGFKYLATVGP
jgi:hypothetical protein